MTVTEAQAYFDTLDAPNAIRFNLLVKTGMKLGKPIEGAYDYAKTMLEYDEA